MTTLKNPAMTGAACTYKAVKIQCQLLLRFLTTWILKNKFAN
jgi:hypothetical protein